MRALRRLSVAPLIVAAAILAVGGGAAHHGHVRAQDCPAGTNWDTVTQTCV